MLSPDHDSGICDPTDSRVHDSAPDLPSAPAISPLSAALQLAARGWRVFALHHAIDGQCSCGKAACDSIGKHPRTINGLKDASTDAQQIARWWQKWPHANIGVRTGGCSNIVVIDIDPRHGGSESLAALEQQYGALPPTVESLTGGGGRHLIFAHPGQIIRNRSGVRPGIDVRADGGYVVGPPSNHASGQQYGWRAGHAPQELSPALLPSWLLAFIVEQASPPSSPAASKTQSPSDDRYAQCLQALLKTKTPDQKDGSRRLFAAACRCVEFDLADADAVSCIQAYARAKPFPKNWSDDEILIRIRDAEQRTGRGQKIHRASPAQDTQERTESQPIPYVITERGTLWMKETRDGSVAVPLMNFSAQIVGELVHDDGAEQRLAFEIEARHQGQTYRFSEPASRFASMNWATEHLGASAFLYPGQAIKDHARCAVQMLSANIPRRMIYEHLGWRELAVCPFPKS
jgi:hypothetical protein